MRYIDTARKCTCSYWTYPEVDCEVHGMDAYYGRYENPWWGRITLPAPR